MKWTILTLSSVKTHSVRYDAAGSEVVTTVYILKSALTQPYPQKIKLTIEPAVDEGDLGAGDGGVQR